MAGQNAGVDQLLERARRGDRTARERLLTDHRARLRKMIAVRMDPRLSVRVDPPTSFKKRSSRPLGACPII